MKIEIAKRERRCYGGCSKPIQPGEKCLVVEKPGWHNKIKENYCTSCGIKIIKLENYEIDKLLEELNEHKLSLIDMDDSLEIDKGIK